MGGEEDQVAEKLYTKSIKMEKTIKILEPVKVKKTIELNFNKLLSSNGPIN
jgi:hypothetical protein